MVVDTSICMVFSCAGPIKGLRFSTAGTSKCFLQNFCKKFTCWKSINISLSVCNEVLPLCLAWISFIGLFPWWAFSHRALTIYYLFSLENTKNAEGGLFKKFYLSDNHGKSIFRQQLPLPHKTMLCGFYKGVQFTSISQHC